MLFAHPLLLVPLTIWRDITMWTFGISSMKFLRPYYHLFISSDSIFPVKTSFRTINTQVVSTLPIPLLCLITVKLNLYNKS